MISSSNGLYPFKGYGSPNKLLKAISIATEAHFSNREKIKASSQSSYFFFFFFFSSSSVIFFLPPHSYEDWQH